MQKKRNVDPLPEEFSTYEEAAEFWSTHDTTDYLDAFDEEPVELTAKIRHRHFEVEVEEDVFETVREKARNSGISVKRLVSELLRRQLATAS